MKKFTLLVAALAISTLASAQLFFSTNLAFHSESAAETHAFEFAPSVGYTFDSWEFGAGFSWDHYKDAESYFEVGAYARYYAVEITDKLSLFVDCCPTFGWTYEELSPLEATAAYKYDKKTALGVSIYPGLYYQITDHFGIDVTLDLLNINYTFEKSTPCNDSKKVNSDEEVNKNHVFNFGGVATSYSNYYEGGNTVSVGFTYCF